MTSFQASQQSICAVRTQTQEPSSSSGASHQLRLIGPGCACGVGKLHVAGRGSVSSGIALPTQGHHLPSRGAATWPQGIHARKAVQLPGGAREGLGAGSRPLGGGALGFLHFI